jgi:hypothetical protein
VAAAAAAVLMARSAAMGGGTPRRAYLLEATGHPAKARRLVERARSRQAAAAAAPDRSQP